MRDHGKSETGWSVLFFTVWLTENIYSSSIVRPIWKVSPAPLSQDSVTGLPGVSVSDDAVQIVSLSGSLTDTPAGAVQPY